MTAKSSTRSQTAERLNSLAVRLIRTVRRADLQAPIGPGQLSAVSVLYFSGRMSLSQLAVAEQVTQPTMSRIVSSLVEARAVRKCCDANDARVQLIELTDLGRTVFEEARERRVALMESLLSGVPDITIGLLDLALPDLEIAIGRGLKP